MKLAKDDSPVVLARQLISAPDPSARGTHAVRTLYYGSGTDKNRAIFKDSVTLKTGTVEGSKLADVSVRKKLYEGGKAAVDASDDTMIALAKLVDADARRVRKTFV